jgi:hypothetical protein
VLLIALVPRLIYVFAISNPENAGDGLYTDVYQHWQIAYLTKEIGLSHGLRLWDLKGVEYFWGSLHPIVLVILFFVTGSTDIVFGLTAFITEWYPWRWMMWILAFPYDFAALLVAIGLFVMLPRFVDVGRGIRPLTWLTAGIALAGVQLTWIPIETAYTITASMWNNDVATGRYIASIFSQPEYRGGVLNLPPPDHPAVTYALVHYGGLEGRHFISQLYDPFYYLPAGYHYVDHPATAGTLLQCWLSSTHTSIFVIPDDRADYRAYSADHPNWFGMVGRVSAYGWTIEAVHVPAPSVQICAQAAQNARAGGE